MTSAQFQGSLSTCECAVPQIKPAWDGHGRLVCEDCHGLVTRAAKMSGQIARPGDTDAHEPTLARRSDGRWGVFCAACSRREQDYIYPCKAFPDDREWPPAVLVEVPDGN